MVGWKIHGERGKILSCFTGWFGNPFLRWHHQNCRSLFCYCWNPEYVSDTGLFIRVVDARLYLCAIVKQRMKTAILRRWPTVVFCWTTFPSVRRCWDPSTSWTSSDWLATHSACSTAAHRSRPLSSLRFVEARRSCSRSICRRPWRTIAPSSLSSSDATTSGFCTSRENFTLVPVSQHVFGDTISNVRKAKLAEHPRNLYLWG